MTRRRTWFAAGLTCGSFVLAGCSNTISGGPGTGATGSGASASTGGSSGNAGGSAGTSHGGSSGRGSGGSSAGGTSAGGSSAGGTSSGGTSSGGSSTGGTTAGDTILPAGIRRLTNREYVATVKALLPAATIPADLAFPPDSRQSYFTRNRAQRVDPVLVKQLDGAAQTIAESVRASYSSLVACTDPSGSDAYAKCFINGFGAKAYRRALTTEEADGLFTLYQTGASGATPADGILLVIRAVLESAGVLYITELGDGAAASGASFKLTARELATSLSYYLTAQPPSDHLLADADAGKVTVADADASFGVTTPVGSELDFATPEALGVWARRLIFNEGGAAARDTVVRMVQEWIGVDRVLETGKAAPYTNFENYRDSLDGEAKNFIAQVAIEGGGVEEIFGANWTMVDSTLAGQGVYNLSGVSGSGFQKVTQKDPRRLGILNQGAFLSVFAHASESAPVLRGVAVMGRVLCSPPQSPANLSDIPPPPAPDPNKTTRERYAAHASVTKCAGCHAPIDAIGFTFEEFDGAGMLRQNDMENGKKVDTATTVDADMGFDITGDFADSGALAKALSQSAQVRDCFARQVFRNAAAVSGDDFQGIEDAFVTEWSANPDAATGKLIDSIVAWATSPIFAQRRAP